MAVGNERFGCQAIALLRAQKGDTVPPNDYTHLIPKGYAPLGKYADKLAQLADELLLLTSLTNERRDGHWIPFSSSTARTLLGGNYLQVMRRAVDTGLVERNQSYCNNASRAPSAHRAFPKSIRLSNHYRTGAVSYYMHKGRQKPRQAIMKPPGIGTWLFDQLSRFTIPSHVVPTNPWEAYSVNAIRRGRLRAKFCSYGRLHTNFTNLARDIRSTLTCDGHELWYLDVRNCQPLILGALARKQSCRPDINRWVEACEEGQLYESLVDILSTGLVPPYEVHRPGYTVTVDPSRWSRDEVKKPLMVAMFADLNTTIACPAFAAIEQFAPSVAEFVLRRKTYAEQLAAECQKAESRVMIQEVCSALKREAPDVPVVTIHDGIVLPESLVDLAEMRIQEAFKDLHNVCPSISKERLSVSPLRRSDTVSQTQQEEKKKQATECLCS